jgi:hypothetical protein
MDTKLADANKDNGQDKSSAVIRLKELDFLRYRLKGMEIMAARHMEEKAQLLLEKAQLMEEMARRENEHARSAMSRAMQESRDLMDELGASYGFEPALSGVSTKGEVVPREMLTR